MTAPRKAALWAVAGALLLTGCEFNGLYDVPLPGGAADDGDAYHVTVEFRDVLDLVPQSAVKVNNVTVGAVEKVELHGWQARVRLRVDDAVKLPANAVAELRQTSILGEKYVSLAKPVDVRPVGRLIEGAKIPLSRSNRNPEIEEVLSALSALLNGGGVAQLHTITVELNHTMAGREDRVKNLLTELNTFLGGLDDQRSEIIRAMKGIDRLSKRLAQEKATIGRAVDTMAPAVKVLADQRKDLTRMLRSLSDLGRVGTKVINGSRDDTIANLRHLQPILTQLNRAGDDLPNALELMTTYPFPRNSVDAIKGDYTNLHITADLDLKSIYGNLSKGGGKKPGSPHKPQPKLPLPGAPDVPAPHVPDLPGPVTPPSVPCLPGSSCAKGQGGDKGSSGGSVLCPPVCTSSYAAYRGSGWTGFGPGVDLGLAELMTKGMQP
ncbi:MCE family protein [Streptomyces gilvosporeus]|uniref:Mammalian cell entry protein n=1 Tax=Streptomyces gilvosporeus TaxID=553510 RepID=A0A1V0TUQ0_9ACTN|nr:MCE family protein [Streptomyces gilvosporeus]ARF56684.1 mammalian cell entry protein [Streptomyces gilvosporeus]